jgi:RND family efflux transporter MFP subunit
MSDDRETLRLKRFGKWAGIGALVVVVLGIGVRASNRYSLSSIAEDNAVPTVAVIHPQRASGGSELALPGTLQAFNTAQIYARTNGYVRHWLVDIGQPVGQGQTLAVIDSPEVDQQLAQARADYQTALANRQLAQTTATRWQNLLVKDAVSKQEADEKAGDLAAKTALANAAMANVRRLEAMQGFERITAPFGGIVTTRSAQVGALVIAESAASAPLFTVSDVHRMRIYVRVPQNYDAQIRPGMHATLSLPQYPDRSFDAEVARTAGAIDVQSGSVLVELQADSAGGALKPGAFAQVHFPLAANARTLTVPASALIVGDHGTSVAIVGAGDRVSIRPIRVARDLGDKIDVAAGLSGGERIVDSPPDALSNGDRVRIQTPAEAAGT